MPQQRSKIPLATAKTQLRPPQKTKEDLLCSSPKIKWAGGKLEWEERQGGRKASSVGFHSLSPFSPWAEKDASKAPPLLPYFTLHGPHKCTVGDATAPSAGGLNRLTPNHTALLLLHQDAEHTATINKNREELFCQRVLERTGALDWTAELCHLVKYPQASEPSSLVSAVHSNA